MKRIIELVEFETFGNHWFWDFENHKTIEWGILNRAKFYVPDNFTVGKLPDGRTFLFNKSGYHCELETSYENGIDGEVFIVDSNFFPSRKIKLERVKE